MLSSEFKEPHSSTVYSWDTSAPKCWSPFAATDSNVWVNCHSAFQGGQHSVWDCRAPYNDFMAAFLVRSRSIFARFCLLSSSKCWMFVKRTEISNLKTSNCSLTLFTISEGAVQFETSAAVPFRTSTKFSSRCCMEYVLSFRESAIKAFLALRWSMLLRFGSCRYKCTAIWDLGIGRLSLAREKPWFFNEHWISWSVPSALIHSSLKTPATCDFLTLLVGCKIAVCSPLLL